MIWSRNGILTKIEEGEPTSLVNSLVYRRKQNGRLRLCLDPKDLNAAIQREHHVTPTLEEILPKLPGATVFSIVDAKCGYWNGVLDKVISRRVISPLSTPHSGDSDSTACPLD